MTWIKKHLKVSVPSPVKQKNEINLSANKNQSKSEIDATKTKNTVSGRLDYTRGNTSIYAGGDSNKNYNAGIRMRNKKGNVSGGFNYNKSNFGNNVGANLKIKF